MKVRCRDFPDQTRSFDTKSATSSRAREIEGELISAHFLTAPSPRNDEVFPGLTSAAIKRAYIRACARAKVDGSHFYDLRHEATSRHSNKVLTR